MKLKRITPLIALVIAAILCFTSCSGSNKTTVTELNNGERLLKPNPKPPKDRGTHS